MDISENEIETVVSKLLDDEKYPNNITARRVVKKIAPYVGRDSAEIEMLQNILDPNANNPRVDEDTLKSAILQWTNSLRNGKNSSFVEEVSLMNTSKTTDQSTFSNISSNGYRERVVEMQNEIAEKEHLIKTMKKQIEHYTQMMQQHEDTLVQMAFEKEALNTKLILSQNNSTNCELLKREYDEQVECLNVYKEKCISLKNTIDALKRDNILLKTTLQRLENEKLSLCQLLATAHEEKEKVVQQLTTSHATLEMCMSDNVEFRRKITEQEQTIDDLNSIKHSLEVDLQNSINKSVHLTQYMEKCDEYFDEIQTEDLRSQLQSNSRSSPRRQIKRCQSESSIGNLPGDVFQNCITSTPKNHITLMEELQNQFATQSPIMDNAQNFFMPANNAPHSHPIMCEAQSTSNTTNTRIETDVADVENDVSLGINCTPNTRTYLARSCRKFVEKETQTDVCAVIALDKTIMSRNMNKNNKIVCVQHVGVKRRLFGYLTVGVDRFLAYGTYICISFACLYLYNTLKYHQYVRQGTMVHVYPSEWFTLREILDSIFDVRRTGPAPI